MISSSSDDGSVTWTLQQAQATAHNSSGTASHDPCSTSAPTSPTTTTQMQVTVPEGVGPGMPFIVETPIGHMQVICPSGVAAGGQIIIAVELPAPPMPVAQPKPQPLVRPSFDAAPVPVGFFYGNKSRGSNKRGHFDLSEGSEGSAAGGTTTSGAAGSSGASPAAPAAADVAEKAPEPAWSSRLSREE